MNFEFVKCKHCGKTPKYWTVPFRIDPKWKTVGGICDNCHKEQRLKVIE